VHRDGEEREGKEEEEVGAVLIVEGVYAKTWLVWGCERPNCGCSGGRG